MSTPMPGPWEADDDYVVYDGTAIAIAQRTYEGEDYESDRDIWQANARLIAAAPELAAVCRELVALFDDGWSADKFSALARRATAALAKAEGKQP